MRELLAQITPPTEESDGNGQAILEEGVGAGDWIEAGIIFATALVVAVVFRRLVIAWVERRDTEHHVALVIGRFITAIIVLAGIIYSLSSLGVRIGPLLGAVGVGGIALAFALQHILENTVAAVLIQARRPFVVGDQITSEDHRGTVEDVNFRAVVLRTEGQNRVFLPSANVLRNPLTNHTAYRQRRTTLMVGIAYGTDLEHAREVIQAAAQEAEGVIPTPPVEVYVEQYGDSSIDFAVRFWHPPRIADEWRVRDRVARAVKRGLDAAGITIPFPQRTLWWGNGGAPGAPEAAAGAD